MLTIQSREVLHRTVEKYTKECELSVAFFRIKKYQHLPKL